MSDIPTTKHGTIDSSQPKAEFNYPRPPRTLSQAEIAATFPAPATAEVKPGWHTSEFWLTALVIIGVFASLILGRITVNDIANLWPLFTGPAAYALSRGLAKKG